MHGSIRKRTIMTNWIHPSLLFILGSFLIPFLHGRVKKAYLILIPVLAFISVVTVSQGTYGVFEFLGHELIFGEVDKLSLIFSYIFTIMAFVGMVYSIHVTDTGQHMAAWFYIGSSLGVTFAGDYFSLFIFWEIMAFASAYLVFAGRQKSSVDAGFRYILIHIVGGLFLLAGILLHYGDTGSFLFGLLEQDGSMAFYLILLGFMLNAAVPPLHAWMPDAYPEASVTGAIFLATYTSKTAVYVLIRAFAGTEILIWIGAIMALYCVMYATLQNDFRRLLSYHIASQIGYMVAAIGLGTGLAIDGATAHAINNILYKGILFMGAGAVIHITGKRRLTDLGGLYKAMPITLILYMIGGFAISGFPLLNGFISKGMIISAAGHDHQALIVLILLMAASGTFLSTTIKIPYYMFFGKASKIEAKEPPLNMLIGMGIAAVLCLLIGIYPGLFYGLLPYPVHFEPFTADHVTGSLGLLMATVLGFFLLLKVIKPEHHISLDVDWFYRMGTRIFLWFARRPVCAYEGFITEISNTVILPVIYFFARVGLWIDRNIVDLAVNSTANFVINMSAFVRRVQTGLVQHYAVGMVIGIMLIIIIYSLIGG